MHPTVQAAKDARTRPRPCQRSGHERQLIFVPKAGEQLRFLHCFQPPSYLGSGDGSLMLTSGLSSHLHTSFSPHLPSGKMGGAAQAQGRLLREQGQHLVLSSPVLEKHLSTLSHQVPASHCQVEPEAMKANLTCCLPLDVRDVQKHGARQHGLWAACIPSSQAVQLSRCQASSFQALHQNRHYTAERHLQPRHWV